MKNLSLLLPGLFTRLRKNYATWKNRGGNKLTGQSGKMKMSGGQNRRHLEFEHTEPEQTPIKRGVGRIRLFFRKGCIIHLLCLFPKSHFTHL